MKLEWKVCFRAGVSIFLLFLCIHYWTDFAGLLTVFVGATSSLLIGGVIAYLINILMTFYEKYYFVNSRKPFAKKSRRPVCMVAAFLTLIAIAVLIVWLVASQLVDCLKLIFAELPAAINDLIDLLEKYSVLPHDIANLLSSINWQSQIQKIFSFVNTGVGNVLNVVVSAVTSVFSGVVTTFLGVIFAIYLLLGKERLSGQTDRVMKRYLKKGWYDKTMYVLKVLNDCFHRYIVGQCIEAVIIGILCTIGMAILRLPYASMIGSLVGFTALIPVAGAYIGAIVGAFMIFMVSPVQAVIFLIFLVILQQLEGNLIYPRVVGSSLGLPAIWVLAAVTVGGGMLGVIGMWLGVPLAAACYRLLREDVNKPFRERKETQKENIK